MKPSARRRPPLALVESARAHRWIGVGAVVVALVVAGTVLTIQSGFSRSDTPTGQDASSVSTETVMRRDLQTQISIDGLLGYADQRTVFSHLDGTVTAARPVGSIVQPGQWLYRVDQRPVVLLDGQTPAWRALSLGASPGADIRELERNLVRMGLGPLDVNGVFDGATERAVERWQRRSGMTATGTVAFGTVVFEPGPRRIATTPTIGSPAHRGDVVLETSSTARQVVVSVAPAQRRYLRPGAHVQVDLPGGNSITGTIAAVARTAVAHPDGPPTVDASIDVPANAVPDLDAAPVGVDIVVEQARAAVSVSVEALLALQGGGFGLEIVEGAGRHRIVPVDLGVAADGFVAVSGSGVEPGMHVVTAGQ